MLILLLLLLVTSPAPATAAGQADDSIAETYRVLVERYRIGWTDEAVEQLLAIDQGRIAALVKGYTGQGTAALSADSAFGVRSYQAAALLHAAAALRCWREKLDRRASAHFSLARDLVDFAAAAGVESQDFRRRWYLATAILISTVQPAELAGDHFAEAVRRVPDDVPILVAAGWFSQRLADLPAARGWDLRRVQVMRRRAQANAVKYLTAALTVNPRSAEAALRLGHVESEAGNSHQAAERLAALLAREDLDRPTAYVGRLVLARLRDREGNAQEAEHLYREAVALDGSAQTARVGLGQLLHAAGGAIEAADVVEPMLSPEDDRDANDPWSDYRLGYFLLGELIFEELHDEVRG